MNNNQTVKYYDDHAAEYCEKTVEADVRDAFEVFSSYLSPHCNVIDIGAGSGRDMKMFHDAGYIVEGIDASEEMCKYARNLTTCPVDCVMIQEWIPLKTYDGIWANASLLHLDRDEIKQFLEKMQSGLRQEGYVYISMKNGIQTGNSIDGRFFINFPEDIFCTSYLARFELCIVRKWESQDALCRPDFSWMNLILQKTRNTMFDD